MLKHLIKKDLLLLRPWMINPLVLPANSKNLRFVLQHGDYRCRLAVMNHLHNLPDQDQLEILESLLSDSVAIVVRRAAIRLLSRNIPEMLHQRITRIKEAWNSSADQLSAQLALADTDEVKIHMPYLDPKAMEQVQFGRNLAKTDRSYMSFGTRLPVYRRIPGKRFK